MRKPSASFNLLSYISIYLLLSFVAFLATPRAGIAATMTGRTLKTVSADIASSVAELARGDAQPDDRLYRLARQFQDVDGFLLDDESVIPADVAWVSGNLDEIGKEPDQRRRRQMLLQWRDTIRLLAEDAMAKPDRGRATRQEMTEALKRAEKVSSIPSGCLWECSSGDGGDSGTPLYDSTIIGETLPVESGGSGGGSGGSGGSGSSSGGGSGGSGGGGSSSGSGGSGSSTGTQGSYRPAGQTAQGKPTGTTQTTVTGKPPAPRYQPPPPPPKPHVKPPAPPPKQPQGDSSWVQSLLKVLYWIIVVLCVIACAIVFWVIWQTWRQRVSGEDSSQLLGMSALPEVRKQAQALFRQAEEAAAANDFQEALRLIMTACLLLLEERSVVAFQETLTNGEYLGRLAERRQLQDLFRDPLKRFDGIVYGFTTAVRSDYEAFRDVFRKLGGAA